MTLEEWIAETEAERPGRALWPSETDARRFRDVWCTGRERLESNAWDDEDAAAYWWLVKLNGRHRERHRTRRGAARCARPGNDGRVVMRTTKQTRMPIVMVPSVPSRGGSLRHASTLGNAPAHSRRGGVLLGVIAPTLRAHEFRGDGARLQEVIGGDRADSGGRGKNRRNEGGRSQTSTEKSQRPSDNPRVRNSASAGPFNHNENGKGHEDERSDPARQCRHHPRCAHPDRRGLIGSSPRNQTREKDFSGQIWACAEYVRMTHPLRVRRRGFGQNTRVRQGPRAALSAKGAGPTVGRHRELQARPGGEQPSSPIPNRDSQDRSQRSQASTAGRLRTRRM